MIKSVWWNVWALFFPLQDEKTEGITAISQMGKLRDREVKQSIQVHPGNYLLKLSRPVLCPLGYIYSNRKTNTTNII